MQTKIVWLILAIAGLSFFQPVSDMFATAMKDSPVSGRLQSGYRVLPIQGKENDIHFTVYRGDYIKFDLNGKSGNALLEIPGLAVRKVLPSDLATSPYFKMKKTGSYPFTLGGVVGQIEVIEYDGARYQILTVGEAAELIANISPVILDVRTTREYQSGYLENSILIPVQELQQRYTELLQYKDEAVFVYCATGNRSTVASKILIDRGFSRVYNLQKGIYDWAKQGYPVIR